MDRLDAGEAEITADQGTIDPRCRWTWAIGLGTGRRGVLLLAVGWAVAAAVLFFCYLRISATMAIESDGGADALQAWAILHGNLLLRGWHLPAVSFYTLDLPEYLLIELARGLGADVIHVGAAATYTLLVLLAAMLARGTATGRQAAVRMLIASGILIAPKSPGGQPGNHSAVHRLLSRDERADGVGLR